MLEPSVFWLLLFIRSNLVLKKVWFADQHLAPRELIMSNVLFAITFLWVLLSGPVRQCGVETGAAGARVSSPGRCHSPDKTSPQSILQFLQLNNFPHGAGAGCRNLDYVFIKGLSWKLFSCPVSGIPQLSLNKLWQTECCTKTWEYRVHLSHLSAISRFQMWLRGRPELRSYF